ncbi:hypothetical protein ATKI12_5032 [Kitasatospora sp. Ki12]
MPFIRTATRSTSILLAAGLSVVAFGVGPVHAQPGGNGDPAPSVGVVDNDKGGAGQGPSITPMTAAPKMTRAEVIARAESWVGQNLKYTKTGETYQGYRKDCSGYASMAWKLATPGMDTTSFVPSGVASWLGSKEELKAGDAMLNDAAGYSGHIVIFDRWTDSTHTKYDGYEFTSSGVWHRPIPYPYFPGYGTFKPARNNSVVDGVTAAPSTVGVYRASDQTFYMADGSGSSVVGVSTFGNPGDVPLTAHWSSTGKDTVGVYRPSDQTFFLTSDNLNLYLQASFGVAGDVPLVGDWDNTGRPSIGVYRPSDQTFYLSSDNLTVKYAVKFGNPGWVPIVGNWGGTGKDTIGAYDPDTQTFYLSNSNTSGSADHVVKFGSPGDRPIKGDWDGSGRDKIGVYRPGTQEFFGAGYDTDQVIYGAKFGNPDDIPITGHWR